jgi:hypothetical protein
MINYLLLFGFIFTILLLLRFIFNFSRSVFSNPPVPYEFEKYEQLYYGLSISYVLTYLIML